MKKIIFALLSCLLFSISAFATITPNFQTWLNANGYSSYDFARTDVGTNGSYGGKASAGDTVVNQPVIFIHGNSDAALGVGVGATGWTSSINYFTSQGYKTSELYATTWGTQIRSIPQINIIQNRISKKSVRLSKQLRLIQVPARSISLRIRWA
jgi:hypothetical protein